MVAHEKRNSAQLFWAVPTQNNLALSFLFFHRPTHRKVGIAFTACSAASAARCVFPMVNGTGIRRNADACAVYCFISFSV